MLFTPLLTLGSNEYIIKYNERNKNRYIGEVLVSH